MCINSKKWNRVRNIFNEQHSQLPVVDVIDNFYRVYYSTRDDKGRSIPMYFDLSKDLSKYEKPVYVDLKLGEPGFFDWSGIMPTEIITLDSGDKYLYYIGWSRRLDVPYHNNLGLAISNDGGNTWNKFSKGPIFHTSYKEPGYIGTAEVIEDKGIFKMWYLSCREWIYHNGIMEPIYDIKYATSVDGINWDPWDFTCIELQNEEGGISSARVIIDSNGVYKMWFSVRDRIGYREDPEKSYRIEGAFSYDGVKWERTGIELYRSESESWDNIMVEYPYIVLEEDKKIMFYNGNGFGKTGIGYAVSENPI